MEAFDKKFYYKELDITANDKLQIPGKEINKIRIEFHKYLSSSNLSCRVCGNSDQLYQVRINKSYAIDENLGSYCERCAKKIFSIDIDSLNIDDTFCK